MTEPRFKVGQIIEEALGEGYYFILYIDNGYYECMWFNNKGSYAIILSFYHAHNFFRLVDETL